MIRSRCLICGSSNIRADRALSGRLVCNSCGTPLGVGRRFNNKVGSYKKFTINNKYLLFILILVLAFLLVII